MPRFDYTEFDEQLLLNIGLGKNTLNKLLWDSPLVDLSAPFNGNAYCVINRRLQALRKRGDIRFFYGAWLRVRKEPA